MKKEHWFEGCKTCDAGMCQEFDRLVDQKYPAAKAAEVLRKDAIVHVMEEYKIDEKTASNIVPTCDQLRDKWRYIKGLKKNDVGGKSSQIPKLSSFNETNDNIEWAKWTWNPVTGCKHGCKYCYARDIAGRFYPPEIGFKPHFYPERLTAPVGTIIPKHRESEEGIRNVFVCSMADLFGEWVPQDWINKTMKVVSENQQWNFLFLTKNPARLPTIDWPENAWVGTTVDIQARVIKAEEAFKNVRAKVRFISCEPLMEPIIFNDMSMFDWLIVGGRSRSSGMEEAQPEWCWVENLLTQARMANLDVYFKPNLLVRPKEYPA